MRRTQRVGSYGGMAFCTSAGTKRRGEDRLGKVVPVGFVQKYPVMRPKPPSADLGLVNDILDAYGNVPSVS